MKAIQFPEANKTYTAEGCHDLPVLQMTHKEGEKEQIFCISAWLPSEKDLEEINKGNPIYLQIYGGQPPVAVYTVNENKEPNA